MNKNLIFLNMLIILLFVIMLGSCDNMAGVIVDIPPPSSKELTPFVITRPVFETTGRPYGFNYAGVVFKFLNQNQEAVEKITVSFMLFDQKTQNNPFIGTNKFEIAKWEMIYPDENKEIIISLDKFIHIAPAEPYLIDSFFISEISYVNGGSWQDKNGKYRVRG